MDRLNAIEEIRNHLKQGGVSIGSWIQIPHPSIAEIMGQAGYDWVAVDMEHGSIAVNQLPDLFRALELGNTLPLARIAHAHPKDCKQALDAGAGGVIVPMIESAEQLKNVRNACCWPPAGNRGVAYSRANLFGKNFEAYYKEAQAPLLIAMIEHYQAVDKLEEIFSVKGLDAILIGPYDLSASMGITAQFDHPDFCSVMKKINGKAKEYGVPSGIHVVAPSHVELETRKAEGYCFIAYSIDAVMFNSIVTNPVKN
jgi:2-dehydro-3-deoxyglucarate aldolase